MNPLTRLCCLLFLPAAFGIPTSAAPLTFQSSETQTSLLELYTSEGCSSCPPAEKWLTSLKTAPGLWKDFVPVAFHVDYWDYLGWRDPWSSKTFTDRQQVFGRTWANRSIYTPEFVLNGKEWRAWSRSKTVPVSTAKTGILKATSSDLKNWEVAFTPTAPSDQTYEAHAALQASGLSSDVKAGENHGRRLEHDFVVLNLSKTKFHSKTLAGSFTLDLKQQAGSYSIAIWITKFDRSEPLQATGGWLGIAQ